MQKNNGKQEYDRMMRANPPFLSQLLCLEPASNSTIHRAFWNPISARLEFLKNEILFVESLRGSLASFTRGWVKILDSRLVGCMDWEGDGGGERRETVPLEIC